MGKVDNLPLRHCIDTEAGVQEIFLDQVSHVTPCAYDETGNIWFFNVHFIGGVAISVVPSKPKDALLSTEEDAKLAYNRLNDARDAFTRAKFGLMRPRKVKRLTY